MSLFELCEWKYSASVDNDISDSKFIVAGNLKELISKGEEISLLNVNVNPIMLFVFEI